MPSKQFTSVVRATLPIVDGAIGDVTAVFYSRMFEAHPELLSDLFNRGNQANGAQRQALAGSITAFATLLLDHPGKRPDVVLSRIAHKHASLGITPEHGRAPCWTCPCPAATWCCWYEEPGDPEAAAGLVDLDAAELPDGVTAYLCGPLPFMRMVRGDLLRRGVPAASVHYEVFGPDNWLGRD